MDQEGWFSGRGRGWNRRGRQCAVGAACGAAQLDEQAAAAINLFREFVLEDRIALFVVGQCDVARGESSRQTARLLISWNMSASDCVTL